MHDIIASGYASSQPAQASTRFAPFPTVQCSWVSSCACCHIVLSTHLLQSLRAAGASLLLLRFPFAIHSIGFKTVPPAVSAAMDIADVAISIAKTIGASLLLFPASPASRSRLPLNLNSFITPVKQAT
jgi:hypothetical protein